MEEINTSELFIKPNRLTSPKT